MGRILSRLVCALIVASSRAAAEDSGGGHCYSSRGCTGLSDEHLARLEDCSAFDSTCVFQINRSSAHDQVALQKLMDMVEAGKREQLHDGALRDRAWMDRFAAAYCKSWEATSFPRTAEGLEQLQKRIDRLRGDHVSGVLLVHSDALEDGLGARFKKAVELVAASLRIGFDAAVLALPPAGSLVHPAQWEHPVWCHESPADGPEQQDVSMPEYPMACWRFDLQRDFMAQSQEPEGRVLFWGAEYLANRSTLSSASHPSRKFHCLRFEGESGHLEGSVWNFIRREKLRRNDLQRLFASARAFAAVDTILPERREVSCGFGGPSNVKHVAMHLRRGDVGLSANYDLVQQLGPAAFSDWLCSLASAVEAGTSSGSLLALHIFTEAAGRSRSSLMRVGIDGLRFEALGEAEDDKPIFHTLASLSSPLTCTDAFLQHVHVVVNNNPRDALLCMARADVLITSLSSLGWTAAVLNPRLVIHPVSQERQLTHWDLRSQYLDWADNWFSASDVKDRPAKLKAFLR